MADRAYQQCIIPDCGATYALDEVLYACRQCGALLDVRYDWSKFDVPKSLSFFDSRRGVGFNPRGAPDGERSESGVVAPRGLKPAARWEASGVWRFRELLPFADTVDLVTIGEGQTILQQADELAARIGVKSGRLFLQYEGFNPSGSFKDNGMAAAFTMARRLGRRRVACASTGNTSASLAMFAGVTRTRSGDAIEAVVFVGGGKIAHGKLSQALDYGARTIQIDGDFDACMRLVQQAADRLDLYLMNSVNPFRLEGQKTIMYRVLEGLGWEVPDWIIVPGGNLGNSSAFGKAFIELKELGLVDRVPRLAIINATGANALYTLYNEQGLRFNGGRFERGRIDAYFAKLDVEGHKAETVASAIEIGRPINLTKALRSLEAMDGIVRQVPDEAILDAKALVGRFGYGCEPASGASVAGLQRLLEEQIVSPRDRVVCILTGHGLKDPGVTVDYHSRGRSDEVGSRHANPPIPAPADIEAIAALLD